jgi:hypothetical protein
MKTPRDLLLARHATKHSTLDAIRRAVIAEHTGPRAAPTSLASIRDSVGHWSGMRRILRVAWVGVAAAWLLILGLNLAIHREGPHPGRQEGRTLSAREVRSVVSEQARLLAQLREDVAGGRSESKKSPTPGPRSESGTGLLPRLT